MNFHTISPIHFTFTYIATEHAWYYMRGIATVPISKHEQWATLQSEVGQAIKKSWRLRCLKKISGIGSTWNAPWALPNISHKSARDFQFAVASYNLYGSRGQRGPNTINHLFKYISGSLPTSSVCNSFTNSVQLSIGRCF